MPGLVGHTGLGLLMWASETLPLAVGHGLEKH